MFNKEVWINNNRISEVCAAKKSRTYEYMEPINSMNSIVMNRVVS